MFIPVVLNSTLYLSTVTNTTTIVNPNLVCKKSAQKAAKLNRKMIYEFRRQSMLRKRLLTSEQSVVTGLRGNVLLVAMERFEAKLHV